MKWEYGVFQGSMGPFKYINRLLMLSNMHVEKHAEKWHEKGNTSYAYTKTRTIIESVDSIIRSR